MDEKDFLESLKRLKKDPENEGLRRELVSWLFEKFASKIWASLFHILKENEICDDLTQDTFLSLFRSIHTIRGESMAEVKGFICITARHLAFAELRNRKSAPTTLSLDEKMEQTQNPGDIYDISPSEVAETLALALDAEKGAGLGEKYEKVFRLWLEDLDYQEISKITNLSHCYVKTLLCRAKKKIARFLRGKGFFFD